MSLLSMFRRPALGGEPSDGTSPALETIATGVSPAFLDAAAETVGGRRERMQITPETGVEEVVAQKLVHFWLQNRNQTLVPLTLNARLLSAEQRATLAGVLAALLTAGRAQADAHRALARVSEWLGSIGADEAVRADVAAQVKHPPPIGPLLERTIAGDLAIYAYVGALVMSDDRVPATGFLLDFLAARLELPSATIRSATRRFRR